MTCMLLTLNQKILRYLAREVSLYVRPTVLLVWIHLLCYVKIVNTFFLVKYNQVKQEVNCTVILPLTKYQSELFI